MSGWTRKNEANKVTQAYSFVEQQLRRGEQGSVLSDALIQARDRDYESLDCQSRNDVSLASQQRGSKIVLNESPKLRGKWVKLYHNTPETEQIDLASSEPTRESVVGTVESISAQWRAKKRLGRFGRAKDLFHKLCGFLNSHSALIKLLPEGNEYVSIFAGSLNAIIKVL